MKHKFLIAIFLGFNIQSFADNKNNDIKISANILAGCVISAEDLNFGIIDFTAEMIHSSNRFLFSKILDVKYQCSPNVSGSISTNGARNIINQSNSSQYFHYGTTYLSLGIHTIPYTFISNGKLESVPIEFRIMNPSIYGNGILPQSGIYSSSQNLILTF